MTTLATEKTRRALQEFAIIRQLEENKNRSSRELLQKVSLQFDLTPLEEDFLLRHYADNTKQENNS